MQNIYDSLKYDQPSKITISEINSALEKGYPNTLSAYNSTHYRFYNFMQLVYIEMFTYHFITSSKAHYKKQLTCRLSALSLTYKFQPIIYSPLMPMP